MFLDPHRPSRFWRLLLRSCVLDQTPAAAQQTCHPAPPPRKTEFPRSINPPLPPPLRHLIDLLPQPPYIRKHRVGALSAQDRRATRHRHRRPRRSGRCRMIYLRRSGRCSGKIVTSTPRGMCLATTRIWRPMLRSWRERRKLGQYLLSFSFFFLLSSFLRIRTSVLVSESFFFIYSARIARREEQAALEEERRHEEEKRRRRKERERMARGD